MEKTVESERVSIIMPCYNDGKYIFDAIESVEKQTYHNIELIVIDDGSDEEETKRNLERIRREKNIIVLQTERLRPAGARNYGISHATGKYILPLDADDSIDKSYVQKCVGILESNEHIGAVYCFADLFGEKCGKWELPPYSFEEMLLDNIVFVTAMFRKEDWVTVGGFDVSMVMGMEDYAFWLSILALEKEIYQIPEVLFHYRIKKESRTSQFLADIEQTKNVNRMLYYNHKEFYNKYAENYALVLRDALIEQIFLRRRYERIFKKFQMFEKIPFIKRGVKRILDML